MKKTVKQILNIMIAEGRCNFISCLDCPLTDLSFPCLIDLSPEKIRFKASSEYVRRYPKDIDRAMELMEKYL